MRQSTRVTKQRPPCKLFASMHAKAAVWETDDSTPQNQTTIWMFWSLNHIIDLVLLVMTFRSWKKLAEDRTASQVCV